MNTNETIEYEIPTEEELDVSVQGAERRGYRAGVEAANDAGIKAIFPDGDYSANAAATLNQALCRFKKKIYQLLAEQGEK